MGVYSCCMFTWWPSSSPVDQRKHRPSSLRLPAVFASQWSVEDRDAKFYFPTGAFGGGSLYSVQRPPMCSEIWVWIQIWPWSPCKTLVRMCVIHPAVGLVVTIVPSIGQQSATIIFKYSPLTCSWYDDIGFPPVRSLVSILSPPANEKQERDAMSKIWDITNKHTG